MDLADLSVAELLARRAELTKYSPDQPREPAGTPAGGEFAGGSDGAVGTDTGLTPGEKDVLRSWTSGQRYRQIQEYAGSTEAERFNAAVARCPAVNGLVYRGVSQPGIPDAAKAADLWGKYVGKDVLMHVPVATSTDPARARGFGNVVFEIDQHGAARDITSYSSHPEEREAVLAPGSYRVDSVAVRDMPLASGTYTDTQPAAVVHLTDVTSGPRDWFGDYGYGVQGAGEGLNKAELSRFVARPDDIGGFEIVEPGTRRSRVRRAQPTMTATREAHGREFVWDLGQIDDAALKRATYPIVIRSGGNRRDAALKPIIARLRGQLIALADIHGNRLVKYSPDQPRDDAGRWTSDGEEHQGLTGSGGLRLVPGPASISKLEKDGRLVKYSEDEPRDEHGRWTAGGDTGDLASGVTPAGFSVHPYRGTSPTTGYQVAMTGRTEFHDPAILDDHAALTEALLAFRNKNADVLTPGGHVYLGGWVQGGKLRLEPSERIASRTDAVRLGIERNQVSVWDNARGEEVPTGGTGTDPGSAKAAGLPGVPGGLGHAARSGEASGRGGDGGPAPEAATARAVQAEVAGGGEP